MAPVSQSVIVFGGTGKIGTYIVDELLKSSKFSIALFTSPNTVQTKADQIEALKKRGSRIIVGDVHNEQNVKNAYKGTHPDFDTVVSAVGRPVILDQIDLLKWAEETPNIKRFYPSEYGTDIEYGPQSVNEKPHQLKLKVRAFVRENIKRLEYTYLVTGPYSDMFFDVSGKDQRAGSFDLDAKKSVLLGTGNDKISFTTMRDVGRLLVASLLHPEESRNKALKVNSFTTTPNEILAEFERQTGGQKWEVSYTPLDELKQIEQEAWEKGVPWATGYTLRRIWTEGGTLYEKRDNEAIDGTDVDTLQVAVAAWIKEQDTGKASL
ncbi:putative isoflavone reductase family protein [Rhizodiscina lignyota]|uniref:Isoflavone reductase family protein n=1 Tax=Rhizodiscina lignyota TaxID=1504668 RepID=A0A9P4IFU1_9PEZI|nr:putative isoflavone reductase family protein [Rhizodiscina lignyota]